MVDATSRADEAQRLLRVASPLGEEHGPPLGSLPGSIHHVVDLLLGPSRFVPHLPRFLLLLAAVARISEENASPCLSLALSRSPRFDPFPPLLLLLQSVSCRDDDRKP
jgi:hypothetical protein